MTPERRRDFETEWPLLAARLKKMLASKGVPVTSRDDIVQETATRLFASWEEVDRSRPAWPLTKVIALNLMRDQARRKYEEVASEIPDLPHHHCVETAGLARLDLQRVGRALNEFTPQARAALLVDVGEQRVGNATAAEKMQRMRARRKLKLILEKAPVAVSLRLARITDLGEWLVGGRVALANGLSCFACAAIGLALTFPGASWFAPRPSTAYPEAPPAVASEAEEKGAARFAGTTSLTVRDAHEIVSATHMLAETKEASPQKAKNGKTVPGQTSSEGGDAGLVPSPPGAPPLPTNGYAPEVTVGAPNTGPPKPGGGGEAPGVPLPGPGESSPVSVLSETQEKLSEKVEEVI